MRPEKKAKEVWEKIYIRMNQLEEFAPIENIAREEFARGLKEWGQRFVTEPRKKMVKDLLQKEKISISRGAELLKISVEEMREFILKWYHEKNETIKKYIRDDIKHMG